jgi:ABC-2 type transport system permease protein
MTDTASPGAPSARTGSIYDLGYRRYEGARLGRGHAIRALALDSFRTAFGIGRGGRAKIAPLVCGALAILPAVIVVGVLAIAARVGGADRDPFGGAFPLGYDTYYRSISVIIGLYCAAEAPELFARDQRHGVIALYFARALRRSDYALARMAGFGVALLVLLLLPMVILLLGRVLLSTDVLGALGVNLPKMPAVVAQAIVIAGVFGGLSMAVSAFTPRRAYATAGIIALFIVPGLVAEIVVGLGSGGIGTILVLLSPTTILDGTGSFFFGSDLPGRLFFFDLPLWTFVVSALAVTAAAVAVVVRRFTRIAI